MNPLNRGFTLLELLLVLSIVGIAAAVVIPRLSDNENTRMQAQVRELVATLNYARRMALIQGQEMVVKLYPPTKEVEHSAPKQHQPGEWHSRGVAIQSKDAKQAKTDADLAQVFEVHFYPGGGSNGGDFELTGGKLTAHIQIDALTGKLKAEFEDD